MNKSVILVGFTEAESKRLTKSLIGQKPVTQVIVVCEPSQDQQQKSLEDAMKSLLLKMPSRPFASMFKKRCPYDNDGDGNCHYHPNGCP